MEINYKKKYLKYKKKYIMLKNIYKYGGEKNIHQIINNVIIDSDNNTNILPKILSEIMKNLKINVTDYMIIASYCLHKYRNITDLDVIVDANTAYPLLKNSGLFEVSVAKISGDERLVLKIPEIDINAEIEIFPKERNVGFPSEYYSLENLNNLNLLIFDEYGNPYYDEITCINQYGDILFKNNKFYTGEYEISLDRVIKNIKHLEIIKNNTDNIKTKMFCDKKILNLKELIKQKI